MSRFEKFNTELDVIRRIEQIRADGVNDSEITVISKQKLEEAYLKYRDVNFKNSEGNTWDKFVTLFSSDDPKDKVLEQFDITESEKEDFKNALENHEILLLIESRGAQDERYVQNTTRETHETQQQDTQSLESKAAQNERLEVEKEASRQQEPYSSDHGFNIEDRVHTDEDTDQSGSLYSSKASTKDAEGGAVEPTYEEQADRASRNDYTSGSERESNEKDNDVTLKDTASKETKLTKDDEYGYKR